MLPFLSGAFSLALLWQEAAEVVVLRVLKMMQGGVGASVESQLMVLEKASAAIEIYADALSGRLGNSADARLDATIRHYRRKVRANRKRLRA